jgi:adenosine deaminase CECR1
MPKGALLHAHMPAVIKPRVLLDLALKELSIHVRVPVRLEPTNMSSTLPIFLPLPVGSQNHWQKGTSISSSDYIPNTWVQIAKARETFDSALGGPKGFDDWVMGSLSLDPSEAYGTHNTVTKVS